MRMVLDMPFKKKLEVLTSLTVSLFFLIKSYFFQIGTLDPFPNDKFWTLPDRKSLQTTISNLMKMTESSPKGWKTL